MASVLVELADSVVAALNDAPGGTFSVEFTAMRKFYPNDNLKELSAGRVSVVPGTIELTRLGRGSGGLIQRDCRVDVGFRKKINNLSDLDETDAYMAVVEEIGDYLLNTEPEGFSRPINVGYAGENIPMLEERDGQYVFTVILQLLYRTL